MNIIKQNSAICRLIILSSLSLLPPMAFATGCNLATFSLLTPPADAQDVIIDSTTMMPATDGYPTYCEVKGRINKTSTSVLHFEVTLPNPATSLTNPQGGEWNGKFIMIGGGGFDGFVPNFKMLSGAHELLNEGYAMAGSDSGAANAPRSFLNNKAELINYGYKARHLVAITTKNIIKLYYDNNQTEAYFIGCSKGGQEALMEVQRYPKDFNGVIAGAPATPMTNAILGFVWNAQAMYSGNEPDETPIIDPKKLSMITAAVMKKCHAGDDIINNPELCHFNPAHDLPICINNADELNCFTNAQIAALTKVYNGTNINGVQLYPGFLPGLDDEKHLETWIDGFPFSATYTGVNIKGAPNAGYAFGENALEYGVFNAPLYQLSSFDFHNPDDVNAVLALSSILDATNADISAFNQQGGKLIIWQGWNDPALSPLATINYYNNILNTMGGQQHTYNFVRLFMAPGVGHCGGGMGPVPSDFQLITALNNWVVNKIAPDSIEAINNGGTISSPLCPYPQIAVLNDGVNSSNPLITNLAINFHCAYQ